MRFSQKLVCTMLLVVVSCFAIGGTALLYGDFTDRLGAAAVQEQARHSMLCYTLESEVLSLYRHGETVSGDTLVALCADFAGDPTQHTALLTLDDEGSIDQLLYDDFPLGWDTVWPAADETLMFRGGDSIWRVYRSDLIDGYALVTAYDTSDIFADRSRSVQRFLLLEVAVLLGAGVAATWFSRRLTRPLALLTGASRRMAAGDYALRTGIKTDDEIGQLSQSFDSMAEAVQDKVAALELSVRQREDFMGAFTHELKTPMTGILGYADLLRRMQPDPEEQREAAGAILHEAKRLESLGGKLLQLLHLDEEELALAPVSLDKAVAAAARAAAPVLEQNGGVRLDASGGGLWVTGDADLLCDLVLNLVSNAAKAGPGPDKTITVTACLAGEWVELCVKDQGCGIPADQIGRVTEPFYMVDKSRARRQGGSGLGLSLCASIARAHGGELRIESEPGRGTAVTVTLRPAPKGDAL